MMPKSQFTLEHEAIFNRIVYPALLLPIGVMVVASLLLAWLVAHLLTVTNWVDHTDKVIAQANHCERLILNMQTDMRGYLLTGNPQFLHSFNQIGADIPPALDALSGEVSDNSSQMELTKTIRAAYGQWAGYASDLLARRDHGADYQGVAINAGEMALMKPVQDDFNRFLGIEETLRTERSQRVQAIDRNIRHLRTAVLLVLGLGIGLYVRRQLRAVARLYDEALMTAEQKSKALQISEVSLLEAQAKLRLHAEDLEKTVAHRTAQLRDTVTELESYSYSVSHDLRAPLRAVRGYAVVLRDDWGAQISAEGKVYLQRMMTACDRMDALIQDVLNYSHLGRIENSSMPIDLNTFIKEIIDHYPALNQLDGEIEVVGPMPQIEATPALLSQCLSNLLNNAVKFRREGVRPQVRVRAEMQGKNVRLWVEDNGIGIAPQYQERIFGVFERIPGKQPYEGTGIGLAIVRKAAERMGGKAGVESELGKGSRFWIDLPGGKI